MSQILQSINDDNSSGNSFDYEVFERLKDGLANADQVVGVFIKSIYDKIDELNQSLSLRQIEQLERQAHTLKSNCKTFGAMSLGDLCDRLENCAVASDFERAEEILDLIRQEGDRVVKIMQNQ